MNQLATVERVCTATGRKQCWFYLFWRLTTFFFFVWVGGLGCFGVFWTISGIVFKAISCQLMTFSNDRLVARARPFPFLQKLQCWLDIGYEYWKRLALRSITNLACETKPTVACNAWFANAWFGLKNCLWNNEFYYVGLTKQFSASFSATIYIS